MPLLLDVRDVSTDDVCIELELKKEADENKVHRVPVQAHAAADRTSRST